MVVIKTIQQKKVVGEHFVDFYTPEHFVVEKEQKTFVSDQFYIQYDEPVHELISKKRPVLSKTVSNEKKFRRLLMKKKT